MKSILPIILLMAAVARAELWYSWTNEFDEAQASTSLADAQNYNYSVSFGDKPELPPPPRDPPSEKLVREASLFRYLYEARFGEGAVTNQAIDEDFVTYHFTVRRLAGLLTDNDISDMTFFIRMFESITGYTKDGRIWFFPWSEVPVFTLPEVLNEP